MHEGGLKQPRGLFIRLNVKQKRIDFEKLNGRMLKISLNL